MGIQCDAVALIAFKMIREPTLVTCNVDNDGGKSKFSWSRLTVFGLAVFFVYFSLYLRPKPHGIVKHCLREQAKYTIQTKLLGPNVG